MSQKNSACNAKLSEYLSGLEVIRGLGLEDWAQNKYIQTTHDHLKSNFRANYFYGIFRPLSHFLCGLPLIVLLIVGGYQVLHHSLNIGVFVAFLRYCERFISPLMATSK